LSSHWGAGQLTILQLKNAWVGAVTKAANPKVPTIRTANANQELRFLFIFSSIPRAPRLGRRGRTDIRRGEFRGPDE
jgi:hypothetical protein